MAADGINQPTNQRPNYFAGQYLLEDDFQLEQQYHIDRQRWHHHLLHISGIAEGLKVEKIENVLAVKISAGSAIDPQGRQIILLESKQIDLTKSYSTSNAAIPDGTYTLYIGYSEQKTDQQTTGNDITSRHWQENPQFQLSSAELKDFIPLAKLTINSNVVSGKIDNGLRVYSGLRLPSYDDGEITLRAQKGENKSIAELNGSLTITGTLSVTDNLGIGTPNPGAKLEIKGNKTVGSTDWETYLLLSGTTGGFAKFYRDAVEGIGNDYLGIEAFKQNNANQKTAIVLQEFGGNVGIGTANPGAKLEVSGGNLKVSGNISATNESLTGNLSVTGNVGIGTTNSPTEKLEISGGNLKVSGNIYATNATLSGNVGIGTTSPSRTLTIKADFSATADAQQLLIQGSTNTNYQLLLGYHTTDNYGSIQAMNQTVEVRPLVLNPAGGNVGISTTTPGAKLSISASDNHLLLRREKTETIGGKILFLELYQDDPLVKNKLSVPEVYPSIRFHHANRYWNRIEAREDGFHFKKGDLSNDDYKDIYAANVASCAETLQMIRGTVKSDGTALPGTSFKGFTVTKNSTGIYMIIFDAAFSFVPTVVATQQYPDNNDFNLTSGDTKDNAVVVGISTTKCLIKCGRADGMADDRRFHFIAIGPR